MKEGVDDFHNELWVLCVLVDVPGSKIVPNVSCRVPARTLPRDYVPVLGLPIVNLRRLFNISHIIGPKPLIGLHQNRDRENQVNYDHTFDHIGFRKLDPHHKEEKAKIDEIRQKNFHCSSDLEVTSNLEEVFTVVADPIIPPVLFSQVVYFRTILIVPERMELLAVFFSLVVGRQ